MKVCIVTARIPPERCGVGDYSVQLGNQLVDRGDEVVLLTTRDQATAVSAARFPIRNTLPGWGLSGAATLWREVQSLGADVVLVQWVPFLYSRTGTNLVFPLTMGALAASGVRVHTMVHEPWVRFIWWSYFLTGPVQRLALGVLVTASERISVSISPWRDLLQSRFPWKRQRIDHVPVGSNIPVRALSSDNAFRDRAGIPRDALVVGVFSLHGAAKAFTLVETAWRAIRAEPRPARLVVIGATADEAKDKLPGTVGDPRVLCTGYLGADEVSAWLQSIDVLLAPFSDGISTRRTSVISALAHGVPVVTTRGRLTDADLFVGHAMALSDLAPDAFAEEALAVCRNDIRRAAMRRDARGFFAEHFNWRVIADRLLPAPETPQTPSHVRARI